MDISNVDNIYKFLLILGDKGGIGVFIAIPILVIIIIGIIGYFISNSFIKSIAKKALDEKFKDEIAIIEKKIEQDLREEFKKRETNLLLEFQGEDLEEVKSNFRTSPILILNDNNHLIEEVLKKTRFENKSFKDNETIKDIDLNYYSMIIIYFNKNNTNEEVLKYKEKLETISDKVLLLIYCEGYVDKKIVTLPINHVITNSQFTLIERLHSAYLIKKIVES